MKKVAVLLFVASIVCGAHGAGFGIYEASARGNALGGTLVGSTKDASANYYNPANMAESTNYSFVVGGTFLTPFCDVKVDGESQNKMNAGWFAIPTFYATIPLPYDFYLGWGNYTEFGLGSKYGTGWDLAGDTRKTTLEQFTFNPNLAYKITDWWSVAGGIRMSYITFENWKQPGYGLLPPGTSLDSHLKGEDWGFGYNAATTFKIRDDLSVGVNYRSRLRHNIKGNFVMTGLAPVETAASAKLTLPQSLTFGANWDATERWHLGAAVTWTEWSSIDKINFKMPAPYGFTLPLEWRDVWRFGLGSEYDLTDYLALRCSYVYDMDPCNHGTTMIPGGDRHIPGIGLGWTIMQNLRLDLGYSLVMQVSGSRDIAVANPLGGPKVVYHFSSRNSFAHIASVSLAYEF